MSKTPDGRTPRTPDRTPRSLARKWLPELDDSFDLWPPDMTPKVTWLKTPDGELGRRPDWLDLAVKASPRWTPPRSRR